jgi:hypothetical protein
MLVDASYAIWGGALAALATLLLGLFMIRRVNHLKQVFQVHPGCTPDGRYPADTLQDMEHRALMFVMDQKTDSFLAALAQTIERERQKLGVVVRKPSMTNAMDADQAPLVKLSERLQSAYGQVLPLAKNGTPIEAIARQLDLSEAEVTLVMRLEAA